MACRKQIKNNLKVLIKTLSDKALDVDINSAIKIANSINNKFKTKVIEFERVGNTVMRNITIPQELVDEYYYSEVIQEQIEDTNFYDVDVSNLKPNLVKYKTLLENSINRGLDRLKNINKQKRLNSSNKELIKELNEKYLKIKDTLYGRGGLIENFEKLQDRTKFENLKLLIEKDKVRIQELIESDDQNDIDEVSRLIDFYKYIDPFSEIYQNDEIEHPFHSREELFLDNKTINPELEEPVQYYIETATFAREQANKLSLREKEIIKETVENENLPENLKEHIFKTQKDVNILEYLFLPPAHSSRNSTSVKVLEKQLRDSVNTYRMYSQNIANRIDEIEKDVIEEIQKLYPHLRKNEIYSIFWDRDKTGFHDGIIRRFSRHYYNEEARQRSIWYKKRFNEIGKIKHFAYRNKQLEKLKREILIWQLERNLLIDIRKIKLEDLEQEFPKYFKDKNIVTDESHVNKIKEAIGENGYNEAIEKAKEKIRNFISEYEFEKEKLDSQLDEGLMTQEDYDRNLHQFLESKDPYRVLNTIENFKNDPNSIPDIFDWEKDSFIVKVPRKYFARIENRKIKETNNLTSYYNENFNIIDNNSTLRKFYNIILDFMQDMEETMSVEDKSQFNPFSVQSYEKSFTEILADKDLNILGKIFEAVKYLLRKLREGFSEGIQNNLTRAYVDPITGKIDYRISSDFLNANKSKINQIYSIKIAKLGFLKITGDTVNLNDNIEKLANVFEIEPNITAFKSLFDFDNPEKFEYKKFLKRIVTDRVVRDRTMDLSKIIKTASHSMALFKARQDILPYAKIVKKYYERINKPKTTKDEVPLKKDGTIVVDGIRMRANHQFDSWFQRAVLGNYSKKSSMGKFIKTKIGKTGNKNLDSILDKINIKLSNVSLADSQDNKLIKEIDEILDTFTPETEEDIVVINNLKTQKENLRRHFSLTAGLMSILSYLRTIGLGYNLSAAITNYAEGQISLFLNMPNYVDEKEYWDTLRITKYSVMKNFFIPRTKKQKKESDLLSWLMENYDVLQDAYNELQKSSVRSKIQHRINKYQPKEIVSRVEYLNQSPILITALKSLKIKDKEGKEASVWEAFLESDTTGKLAERFRTDENIYNFEILSADETKEIIKRNPNNLTRDNYNKVKNMATELIIRTQGDYSELGGNIVGDNVEGLVFMLFRRWLPMLINTHFKGKDYNLYTGKYEKGRKRSMTAATGSLHMGTLGFITAGPIGALVGAGFGGLLVTTVPYFRATKTETENLGFINELLLNTIKIAKNIVSLPVNIATGKDTIKTENFKSKKLNEWNKKVKLSYDEIDYKNMIGNLREISVLLFLTGLSLLVKGMTRFDDDDKEQDRPLHNVFVNKLMQLSQQVSQYSNPVEMYQNLTDLAFIRFLDGTLKTVQKTIDYVEGNDVIMGGTHKGESALANQFRKTFLPVPMRGYLGFSSSMERQFYKSPYDSWFWTQNKRDKQEISAIRAKYRRKLIDKHQNKLSIKQINGMVNKKYHTKRKNQNYTELLRDYSKVR